MSAIDPIYSSCRLRNRYLSKLGIHHPNTTKPITIIKPKLVWRERNGVDEQRTSIDEKVLPEEVPELSLRGLAFLSSQSLSSLTCDGDDDSFYSEEDILLPSMCEATSTNEGGEEIMSPEDDESDRYFDEAIMDPVVHRVKFHPSVAVLEIPSHRDYDETTRRALWRSHSVQEMTARINTLEFLADQKDWRNACEEEDMVEAPSGELVHPATWKLICQHMERLKPPQGTEVAQPSPRTSPGNRRRKHGIRKRVVCAGGPPSLTRFADS